MPPPLAVLQTVPKSSTTCPLPRSPFPIGNRQSAIANSPSPPTLLQSALFPLPPNPCPSVSIRGKNSAFPLSNPGKNVNFYQVLLSFNKIISENKKSKPLIMPHFGAVTSQKSYSGRNAGFIRQPVSGRACHSVRAAFRHLEPGTSPLGVANPARSGRRRLRHPTSFVFIHSIRWNLPSVGKIGSPMVFSFSAFEMSVVPLSVVRGPNSPLPPPVPQGGIRVIRAIRGQNFSILRIRVIRVILSSGVCTSALCAPRYALCPPRSLACGPCSLLSNWNAISD
jgi:hypothetical protein